MDRIPVLDARMNIETTSGRTSAKTEARVSPDHLAALVISFAAGCEERAKRVVKWAIADYHGFDRHPVSVLYLTFDERQREDQCCRVAVEASGIDSAEQPASQFPLLRREQDGGSRTHFRQTFELTPMFVIRNHGGERPSLLALRHELALGAPR